MVTASPDGDFPIARRTTRDARITARLRRGGPMFDLLYLLLTVALFAISIAMIRFFDRL